MLAIPGSVHIGSARSTRSAIQILAPHLESAVFISCNLEPWKLGRDRFELREMFGRYSYITQTRGACAARDGDVCGAWARCEAMSGARMAPSRVPLGRRLPEPHAPTGAVRDHEGGCWPSRALCTSTSRVLRAPLSRFRPSTRESANRTNPEPRFSRLPAAFG